MNAISTRKSREMQMCPLKLASARSNGMLCKQNTDQNNQMFSKIYRLLEKKVFL